MEEKMREQGKKIFATLCQLLDKDEWKYTKDEEKLSISAGVQGEDLPMDIHMAVDVERGVVMVISHLPFAIAEEKRLDAAIAVCAINNIMVSGCFDYDIQSGNIFFRMSNTFIGCQLSEQVLGFMLYCSCKMIDDYNDKFLMLSKGLLTIQQFLDTITD